MPTSWTHWCSYCGYWRSAWDSDHRRCWTCDNWTLSCNGCHGCHDHGTSEALKSANNRNEYLSTENSRLHGEIGKKTTEVGEKEKQIAIINKDLEKTQLQLTKTEGDLTVARGKVEELTGLFNNLKIESSNKIILLDKELEDKNKDIKGLKGEVEKLQEEDFRRKFQEQEEGLDEFVDKLGIDRQKYRDLLKFYQQLVRFGENYNQDKIDEAEEGIEAIKDQLLSNGWLKKGVNLKDVKELCNKCENFARLKVEKGRKQEQKWQQQQQEQQYEARQEQPTNNRN